jgi:hypothetical protein
MTVPVSSSSGGGGSTDWLKKSGAGTTVVVAHDSARGSTSRLRQWERSGFAVVQSAPASVPANKRVALSAVDGTVRERIERDLKDSLLWVDDGLCEYRAVVGALHASALAANANPQSARRDALAGAVVLAGNPRMAGTDWAFHAATVVRPRNSAEPVVVDYLLFDNPVPLSVWRQRLHIKENDTRIVDPRYLIDDHGIGGFSDSRQGARLTAMTRADVAKASHALSESWEAAARVGSYRQTFRKPA